MLTRNVTSGGSRLHRTSLSTTAAVWDPWHFMYVDHSNVCKTGRTAVRGLSAGDGVGYISGDHYVPVQVCKSTIDMWPAI